MRHPHRAAAPNCAGPGSRRGFTVVELIAATAIVAITVTLALPSFQTVFMNMRLTSYANELVAASMMARSRAISQNATVTLCQSQNGATCGGAGSGWGSGYLVTCRSNDGLVCTNSPTGDAATIVLANQPKVAVGWQIVEASGVSTIVFQPTGTGATSASLTVCRAAPLGNSERVVRISPTGRTSVAKTFAGVCG